MPAEPQDEDGVGSSFAELVEEQDVPRVGDEGVEAVAVAGQQVSGGTTTAPKATKSTSAKSEA
jgi:hypothetical protein